MYFKRLTVKIILQKLFSHPVCKIKQSKNNIDTYFLTKKYWPNIEGFYDKIEKIQDLICHIHIVKPTYLACSKMLIWYISKTINIIYKI